MQNANISVIYSGFDIECEHTETKDENPLEFKDGVIFFFFNITTSAECKN